MPALIKGITLNLGGEDYIVPPLSLGSLELLQERLDSFTGGIDGESIKVIIDVAMEALTRNYSEMTREKLVSILDVSNMGEVFEAVMDVSGLKRKEAEAGEAGGQGS